MATPGEVFAGQRYRFRIHSSEGSDRWLMKALETMAILSEQMASRRMRAVGYFHHPVNELEPWKIHG